MSINQNNYRVATACLFCCIATYSPLCSKADDFSLVVPPEYENVEGDDGNSLSWSYPTGWAWQTIQSAESFAQVPSTHPWMTAMLFRPDGNVNRSYSRTWPDFTLTMGTTTMDLADISQDFAINRSHIDDLTVVHQGPITWSSENIGPTGGGSRLGRR